MTYNDDSVIKVHYHDGKPEIEKEDPSEEIRKELHPKQDKLNSADHEKSALYAGLPKATQKRDKSIDARIINTMLESFKSQRYEAKFKVRQRGNTFVIETNGLTFECYVKSGIIYVIGKNGKSISSISSSELKNANIDKYFDKIEQYLSEH